MKGLHVRVDRSNTRLSTTIPFLSFVLLASFAVRANYGQLRNMQPRALPSAVGVPRLSHAPPVESWGLMASCLRGTGVASFDYADFGEKYLGLPRPYFFCIRSATEPTDAKKIAERFGEGRVVNIDGWPASDIEVDAIIKPYKLSHLYMLKSGAREEDGNSLRGMRHPKLHRRTKNVMSL